MSMRVYEYTVYSNSGRILGSVFICGREKGAAALSSYVIGAAALSEG
jgi:hypothetical protein